VAEAVEKANGPGSEIGASGLNAALGGQVMEEMHPNLHGRKAIEVYRTMKDSDSVVGSILFAIEMLARQVDWRVDQKDAEDEHAEFLESCIDDMSHSWGDFISEILSMLPYGFAFHEIVYKKRAGYQPDTNKTPSSRYNDGKIGWRKIPLRAQETLDRWQFDTDGGLEAFVQKPPPDYKDRVIPMAKGLLFRTSVYKNNPEGRSVLRSAYVSWFYKKRIQQVEGTGIERDLAGFPVFWMPAEMMADDASTEMVAARQAFVTAGQNIRRDKQEFLMMPLAYDQAGNKLYDFELMSSGGARAFDTGSIIERYNKEIAMTVLADFILLGHEGVGSFALSSDKTDLFAVALGTFLDIIKDVLNRFAVPRLFALNGFPVENLPEITHDDIETPNLGELASYIQTLTGAGVPMFPDEDLETYLREIAGLPPKSEEAKKAQEEQRQEEQPDETGTGEVEEDVEPGSDPAGSAAGSGGGSAARDAIAAARASRAG
jgi:hypothetical protein